MRRGLLTAMGVILRFGHRGSKSRCFMEPRLVTRGVASGLLLTGGRTGTLSFKPLVACHVCLIFLDGLVHLLRGQLAPIFGDLGVQDMSNLLLNPIQGNLILEGLELFLHEFILPIFAQITHRGANSYQKVYGSILRSLVEILNGIPLLSKGE